MELPLCSMDDNVAGQAHDVACRDYGPIMVLRALNLLNYLAVKLKAQNRRGYLVGDRSRPVQSSTCPAIHQAIAPAILQA